LASRGIHPPSETIMNPDLHLVHVSSFLHSAQCFGHFILAFDVQYPALLT
jgi:hypothetical protein